MVEVNVQKKKLRRVEKLYNLKKGKSEDLKNDPQVRKFLKKLKRAQRKLARIVIVEEKKKANKAAPPAAEKEG